MDTNSMGFLTGGCRSLRRFGALRVSRQLRQSIRCAGSSVQVTREVVVKTAKLAQFEMSEEELDRMTSDFKGIIGFVEQINSLDIDGVEPTLRIDDKSTVLRDDVPAVFPNQDELLAEAPLIESDFIRVPQIISDEA